jgi:hypothetical protein
MVGLVLGLASGSAQAGRPAPSEQLDPPPPTCSSPSAFETLSAFPGDIASAERGLVWAGGRATRSRSLVSVTDVRGSCAAWILTAPWGLLYLPSGAAFHLNDRRQLVRAEPGPSLLNGAAVEPKLHPTLEGWEFKTAARVRSRRVGSALVDDYLGLWTNDHGSGVLAFSELKPGEFSKPRMVLSSKEPLLGLSYFPSPDTNYGSLGLLRQTGPESVQLIYYNWLFGAALWPGGETRR